MLEVILDNVSCLGYGLVVANKPIIPSAKEKINIIEIQGRDSGLTEKQGYENKIITINFGIEDKQNLSAKIRSFAPYIIKAKTLKFSDDLEVYYKIKSIRLGDIERQIGSIGRFTVIFTVEPFVYLENELISIEKNTILFNQGTYQSLPYFKICGSGDINVIVNNKTITLNGVKDYIEIDSELMQCRKGNENTSNSMIGDFPVFHIGENTISFTGATKIEINPRWRYL